MEGILKELYSDEFRAGEGGADRGEGTNKVLKLQTNGLPTD